MVLDKPELVTTLQICGPKYQINDIQQCLPNYPWSEQMALAWWTSCWVCFTNVFAGVLLSGSAV